MERREFLRSVAIAGGLGAMGLGGVACAPQNPSDPLGAANLGIPSPTAGRDRWARQPSAFNRKIRRETPKTKLNLLQGTVPNDLAGHVLFQSLSLLDSDAGFSGDSMLWRIDFDEDGPVITSKLLRSSDYLLAEAVRDTNLEFESRGMGRMGPLGLLNQSNTALVELDGNRVVTTVDAGRPWEIDPKTLLPKSPVGTLDDYRPVIELPDAPDQPLCPLTITSAHPPYDPHTGEFYGIAFSLVPIPGMTFCELHQWDGSGELRKTPIISGDGSPVLISQSAHQMCVTRDYIVVLDASITLETGKLLNPPDSWAASFHATPRPTSDIYIIDRQKLRESTGAVVAHKCSIPRESGHLMVDYDHPQGRVIVHSAYTPAMDVGEWVMGLDKHPKTRLSVREDLVNCISPVSYDIGVVGRYEINARTGKILESSTFYNDWTWGTGGLTARNKLTPDDTLGDVFHANSGFPTDLALYRVYQGFADYEYRIVETRHLPWEGVPSSLVRIDHDAQQVKDGYYFTGDQFVWTVTFVPRIGTATGSVDGYVVAVVFSDDFTGDSDGTQVWIFDAANLGAGSLCRLGNDTVDMPLTLHSLWLGSLESTRPDYYVDVEGELLERAETWSTDRVSSILKTDVLPAYATAVS